MAPPLPDQKDVLEKKMIVGILIVVLLILVVTLDQFDDMVTSAQADQQVGDSWVIGFAGNESAPRPFSCSVTAAVGRVKMCKMFKMRRRAGGCR